MSMRLNKRKELELEKFFLRIRAPFTIRFLVTFWDLFYILLVNIPVLAMVSHYRQPEKGWASIITAFHNMFKSQQQIPAWRLFVFSVWLLFFCYVYFVFIPSKTHYQTFFSDCFGIKAVTLNDSLNWRGHLSQWRLFKANFVPIFIVPLLNMAFWAGCWVKYGRAGDWKQGLFSQNGNGSTLISVSMKSMKSMVAVAFFIQVHYLFTVALSRKALNWFVKSNEIIYIDMRKADLVMGTEDKPISNKDNLLEISMPGTNRMALEELKKQKKPNSTLLGDEFDDIDLTEDIEII